MALAPFARPLRGSPQAVTPDALHCEHNQVDCLMDTFCSGHFRSGHCQSPKARKPWAHKPLLVEIPVPTDKNPFVFDCGPGDNWIRRIDGHDIAQPHNVMAKVGQCCANRVWHVVVGKESKRLRFCNQAALCPSSNERAASMSASVSPGNSSRIACGE